MKVKAKVECIDSLFNRVGDILEVPEEYGKHLIGIDYAESAEEKKASTNKKTATDKKATTPKKPKE